MLPRRRPDLTFRLIEGEVVIMDREAGKVHQLNASASYVWYRCDGSSSVGAIAEGLAESFDVDPEAAHADVGKLLQQLWGLGLLDTERRQPERATTGER